MILSNTSSTYCCRCGGEYSLVADVFFHCKLCDVLLSQDKNVIYFSASSGKIRFVPTKKQISLWGKEDEWTSEFPDVEMDFDPQTLEELFNVVNLPQFIFI